MKGLDVLSSTQCGTPKRNRPRFSLSMSSLSSSPPMSRAKRSWKYSPFVAGLLIFHIGLLQQPLLSNNNSSIHQVRGFYPSLTKGLATADDLQMRLVLKECQSCCTKTISIPSNRISTSSSFPLSPISPFSTVGKIGQPGRIFVLMRCQLSLT